MRKLTAILLLAVICLAASGHAQETYFGKNKVRYKDFDWSYIQTRHFDIHFYEDAYPTSEFAAAVLESAYVEISDELDYKIQHRVPIFIYNSHNDFQQTNIISGILPEGVGGFTEPLKNRVVIPLTGSYEDFRHVLHHELVHAVCFDMLYGKNLASLISRRRLFQMPLWLAEGLAEYSSRHGWDYFSDMFVRDATITGYLAPPDYLGGFLAYKQGQAMIKFIVDNYGEDRLGKLLRKGKVHLTMKKAIKEALGIEYEKFWEEFSKEMKRRYWPEIAIRDEPQEIAKQLTKARKDGSYYNEKPTFSPDGDRLAFYTDRSDYTQIVMISATDGKTLAKLAKAERSGDLESLHSYVSGLSFSPDGKEIVFIAKSKGKEAIFFYDLHKRKAYRKQPLDYYNIISPVWSPNGKMIAFSALKGYKRDIFVYYMDDEHVEQITDDRFDEIDLSWNPESNLLAFSSDREHPYSYDKDSVEHLYVGPAAYRPGDFDYGYYNLFTVGLDDRRVEPLDVGPGENKKPIISPDGTKVAFISNRNGIDNIYIGFLDSTRYYAVTNLLTGASSISWSPDGAKIAFSAFNKGSFDIFVLKDIVPIGDDGVLTLTGFQRGDYDLLKPELTELAVADSVDSETSGQVDTTTTDSTVVADLAEETTADSASVESDSTITTTGVYDDEYVYVSENPSRPYEGYLVDVINDSTIVTLMEEPAHFDSIAVPLPGDDYDVRRYRAKLSPDYVGGGFTYDTFFGVRGQTQFVFSDYLGNHQLILATDLVNTIDQSNIQAYYIYGRKRTRLGVGLFHTKNFYEDNYNFLFSDRFYGAQLFASRPSSKYSRLQLTASQYFIDRQYYDILDTRENRNTRITTGELAWIKDNIIWGITGPVNGSRSNVDLTGGLNLFDSDDLQFAALEFDYRRYWHFKKSYSMALRLSGGASVGRTPKLYFLGGTTNWIGKRTLDATVYQVENLYFSDVITPLRGVPYYELVGNRYGLVNWEFRFPMIDYFAMRFPLPLVLSRVGGVIFTDIGAAWFYDDFKGGTSDDGGRLNDIHAGFGCGMRANLGFLVLRYDLAWKTDLKNVSEKPHYYFSLGADF